MAKKVDRLAESFTYVLKADQLLPKDQQTTFHLAPMLQGERMRVWDNLNTVTKQNDRTEVTSRSFQQARELCIGHIISIDNFPVGAPKPWPKDLADREAYLEQLEDLDVWEVGNELRERSSLGKTPPPKVSPTSGVSEPVTDATEEAKQGGNC